MSLKEVEFVRLCMHRKRSIGLHGNNSNFLSNYRSATIDCNGDVKEKLALSWDYSCPEKEQQTWEIECFFRETPIAKSKVPHALSSAFSYALV